MPDNRHGTPSSHERLARYWDDVMRGQLPSDAALDAELSATIRRFHEIADRDPGRGPDPRFVEHVMEELMATAAPTFQALPDLAVERIAAPNGSAMWPPPRPMPRLPAPRSRWALGQVATAALVLLTVVASYFAFAADRIGRQSDQPALIPAVSGTPATPDAAATAPQVAELVWSLDGGPELPFDDPYKVAIDPSGNLWVPGGSSGQFLIFDSDGTFLETWGTPGSGDGQFDFDYDGYGYGGIVWDANGNFYVADAGNRRIQKFGPDRTFLTSWGSEGRENGQFLGMGNLAIDQQGRLFAADHARDDIQVFDLDGHFLDVWGGYGLEAGQLANPGGIAIDADGNLYICEYSGHRIQKFAPDGTSLAIWGSYGRGEGEFSNPNDVTLDAQGRVYVTDWGNNRIQVFDGDGRFLAQWGGFGLDQDGTFVNPTGTTVDGAGYAYVAEESGDRVQKFRLLPPLAS